MKKKYVSFQKVKQNLVDINSKINQTNWKPDIILSVNRGGCVPGVFLSHMRDLDHEVLSFKNNIQQSSQRKMWFLNKKNKNLDYKI